MQNKREYKQHNWDLSAFILSQYDIKKNDIQELKNSSAKQYNIQKHIYANKI